MILSDLDGLIVVGSIDQRPLRQIYAQNDNLVFVHNLHHHDPDYDAVWSDLEQATEQCLDELVALGHRSIGYIGGPDSIQNIITREIQNFRDVRELTFERKLKELGIYQPEQVYIGNWSAAEGHRMAAEAVVKGPLPTAFLIGSDPLSMGALRAFREAGIRVPEDLSIISFDDIEAAAYMTPPLVDRPDVHRGDWPPGCQDHARSSAGPRCGGQHRHPLPSGQTAKPWPGQDCIGTYFERLSSVAAQ
ncbi:MAG: substrate-binding domain-containing protein [Clostridiales bacterium]|nr:substrate-binding domain-containing protein [Clostridiales bacterium]